MLLSKLKETAEVALDIKVVDCVISVSCFTFHNFSHLVSCILSCLSFGVVSNLKSSSKLYVVHCPCQLTVDRIHCVVMFLEIVSQPLETTVTII